MGSRNIVRNASLVLSAIAAAALAQTPAPPPAFEVASIRPAPPLNPADIMQGKVHIGTRIDAGRVDIGALSMKELIHMAWEVKPYQISGPDWISTERFSILAKMPDGATKEQVPAMLKALLQERFKLATHKENREHPVYALIVRKNGAKLEEASAPAASESQAPSDDSPSPKKGMSIDTPDGTVRINRAPDGKGVEMSNPKTGPSKMTMGPDGLLHMDMSRVTMANFADMLSRYVDRPVIDETGLKGEYHVALDLSMQDMIRLAKSAGVAVPGMGPMAPAPGGNTSPADAASDPGGGGSVFNAVERLGLKLDPRKEPVETIVVDHIEKTPTEN